MRKLSAQERRRVRDVLSDFSHSDLLVKVNRMTDSGYSFSHEENVLLDSILGICAKCGDRVEHLHTVQDPDKCPDFVLGGIFLYPCEVCEPCKAEIAQDFRDRMEG